MFLLRYYDAASLDQLGFLMFLIFGDNFYCMIDSFRLSLILSALYLLLLDMKLLEFYLGDIKQLKLKFFSDICKSIDLFKYSESILLPLMFLRFFSFGIEMFRRNYWSNKGDSSLYFIQILYWFNLGEVIFLIKESSIFDSSNKSLCIFDKISLSGVLQFYFSTLFKI